VDISPKLIDIARRGCPADLRGAGPLHAGDMLTPRWALRCVVAMDSLIYYSAPTSPRAGGLAARAGRSSSPSRRAPASDGDVACRQAVPARRPLAHDGPACARAGRARDAARRAWRACAGSSGSRAGSTSRRPGAAPMIQPAPPPQDAVSASLLPFADAASEGLPLGQLLRLSLFQISVGMATVLLLGTLNRVMIVELSVPPRSSPHDRAAGADRAVPRAAGLPVRHHRSAIGWKRVPYLWFGSLWQFGGLAIMPFALMVLSGDTVHDVPFAGEVLAALAFLMTGLGMHMTQTAGLALAADRADDETRPRVVALLYVMFLVGMAHLGGDRRLAAARFQPEADPGGAGRAVVTLALNLIALWKQERVRPMTRRTRRAAPAVPRRLGATMPRAAGRASAGGGLPGAPWPSTCRTCCWSPMAARSWACRSRRRRC
jgi:hypothetical protein